MKIIYLVFGALLMGLLLAGCAQQPPRNETNQTPPPQAPPVQPPPQAPPPPPPVKNQTNNTNGTLDADVFTEDLTEALDDLDAVTDPADLQQTSEKTSCDSDEDCWCRVFNGAQFLPGKTPWDCDEKIGRCSRCIYK